MTKSKDEVFETPDSNANSGGQSPFSSSFSGNAANTDTPATDGETSSASGGASQADGNEVPVKKPGDKKEEKMSSCDDDIIAEAEAIVDQSNDEKVAAAQKEMQEWKDKYLRLHAEWDTYRRRTSEQRAEERANATEKLVEHLLPVIDDFERTIDYAEKNGESGLIDGVKAVNSKLADALKKEGVEIINPVKEAFDSLECQAVGTVDDTSVPDETVAEVYQKGYKMGRKVLRPAMVTVAVGGPKREVPEDAGE